MKFLSQWVLVLLALPSFALAFTFDPNVPQAVQQQMLGDLAFIGTVQGNGVSQLHQKIFGPVSGATYSKFFNSRVTAVGLSDCGSPKAVACVDPFEGSSKMWLTNNYINFDHPQIARLMVVFHESRHTEVAHGNWPHATCPDPFVDKDGKPILSIWTGATLAGEPACDVTPFGSYGSSLIMLKNIQKFCANCTDKVREDAGIYADDQFKRITRKSAANQILKDLYNGIAPKLALRPETQDHTFLPQYATRNQISPRVEMQKLNLLEQLIRSRNDNDPRLDQLFNGLSDRAKASIENRYRAIPMEKRNARGKLVYVLAKNLNDEQDFAFLREVLNEPLCRSLANCGSEGPNEAKHQNLHHEVAQEVTLAYPQMIALGALEKALALGSRAQQIEALRILEEARSSRSLPVAERASDLLSRFER